MIIMLALFGEFPKGLQNKKIVYIEFASAPGVTINTPVRKSGILVGRVENVELKDTGSVMIIVNLDPDKVILENELCRISTGNFLGDAMLEFIPSNNPDLSREPLKHGALLTGIVSRDALSAMTNALSVFDDLAGSLKETLASIENVGNEIGQVAKNMNVLVVNNQDQFNRILGKAESALGRFDTVMVSMNQVVGDDELADKLRTALDAVPTLVSDTSGLIKSLQDVANEAEANLRFLQGLTKPLGEKGNQIVSNLDQSVLRLDGVLQELQVFTKAINNSEGTLGQFVHNPELFNRLNQAAGNIEEITYQLQPVVYDARVITDKLARNPGRILRGAWGKQQSGLK